MDKIAFGKRLQSARKEKKLTAEALARQCNLNSVFIRQIEGGSKTPSVPTLILLSNNLRASVDHLLSDSLDNEDKGEFELLWKKARSLSPKQRAIVIAMIDTLVDKLED